MLQRAPHPTFEFSNLVPAAKEKRFSSLPQARQLVYFYNARAALFHIFRELRRDGRRRVLLPAFHCISMVEPALRAGMMVGFYRIDRSLEIDHDELLSMAQGDVAAVVIVNFFGMPANFEALREPLRARGIPIIEDCSHSFLLTNPIALAGGRADLSVYSFWKLVPSGTGGGLLSSLRKPEPPLSAPPLKDSLVRTKQLFEEAVLARGTDSMLARLYARLEAARVRRRIAGAAARPSVQAAPVDDPALEFDERKAATRFPWLARHIVDCADLQAVAEARRRNYLVYARRFAGQARPVSLLPQLPARVCPWAYPIIVPQRSVHDQQLRQQGVPVWTFGNVLHPALDGAASPAAKDDAQHLATTVLCLPVHQGISEQDVEGFADATLDHFRAGTADAR